MALYNRGMLWFDTLLILLIISAMLAGFADGFVLQAVNLLGLYVGLALAAAYQPRISRIVRGILGPTETLVRDTVIFLLITVIIWVLINVATRFAFEVGRLRTGQTLDRLGGLALGLLSGFILSLLAILLLSFMTSVPWPDYNGLRLFVVNGMNHSQVRDQILSTTPLLVEFIRPWVSGYIPPILFPAQ